MEYEVELLKENPEYTKNSFAKALDDGNVYKILQVV